jgi:hypothetical protein
MRIEIIGKKELLEQFKIPLKENNINVDDNGILAFDTKETVNQIFNIVITYAPQIIAFINIIRDFAKKNPDIKPSFEYFEKNGKNMILVKANSKTDEGLAEIIKAGARLRLTKKD